MTQACGNWRLMTKLLTRREKWVSAMKVTSGGLCSARSALTMFLVMCSVQVEIRDWHLEGEARAGDGALGIVHMKWDDFSMIGIAKFSRKEVLEKRQLEWKLQD